MEISREALKEVERKVTLLVLSTEPDYSLRIDGLDFDDGELRGTTMPERLTWERITDPKKLKESLIVLLYSSGTTGEPKGRRGKEDPKADNTYTNGIQASCSPI